MVNLAPTNLKNPNLPELHLMWITQIKMKLIFQEVLAQSDFSGVCSNQGQRWFCRHKLKGTCNHPETWVCLLAQLTLV